MCGKLYKKEKQVGERVQWVRWFCFYLWHYMWSPEPCLGLLQSAEPGLSLNTAWPGVAPKPKERNKESVLYIDFESAFLVSFLLGPLQFAEWFCIYGQAKGMLLRTVQLLCFILFVLGHTWNCLVFTPVSLLRNHSRWCLGEHVWCHSFEPWSVTCKASTLIPVPSPAWDLHFDLMILHCLPLLGDGASSYIEHGKNCFAEIFLCS